MLDLGRHPDLEPTQSRRQALAEAGVDVELEHLVVAAGDPGERLDLAVRFEHERPRHAADRQGTDVLGDLRLQVRQRIRTADDDPIASGQVEERRVEDRVGRMALWFTTPVCRGTLPIPMRHRRSERTTS